MKMRAAQYSGIGRIEFQELEKPVIKRDELLIKVQAANICGTDLRIFKSGHFKIQDGEKRILGHEIAGEVWEVGSEVDALEEGMRVGIAPNIGCGHCRFCRMGQTQLCPDYEAFGISLDGGFAEFMKVHPKAIQQGNLVPYRADISFEEVALAEPFACCYKAYKTVRTQPGETVLIVGAGPMGTLHLLMNRLAGAGKILVADIADSRLNMVQKFGADRLINTQKEDLLDTVMSCTGGNGADVVFTACPVPEIQQLSIRLASKLGRINFFGGLPKKAGAVELNTNLIHYNGLIVTGNTGASLSDYEHALGLIIEGKIDTKPLISRRFKLEDVGEAFEYALSGKGLKTLFEF
jgi:threonine dehydrogenase-like Zn-dependent dehydrogenase